MRRSSGWVVVPATQPIILKSTRWFCLLCDLRKLLNDEPLAILIDIKENLDAFLEAENFTNIFWEIDQRNAVVATYLASFNRNERQFNSSIYAQYSTTLISDYMRTMHSTHSQDFECIVVG